MKQCIYFFALKSFLPRTLDQIWISYTILRALSLYIHISQSHAFVIREFVYFSILFSVFDVNVSFHLFNQSLLSHVSMIILQRNECAEKKHHGKKFIIEAKMLLSSSDFLVEPTIYRYFTYLPCIMWI